MLYQALIGAWEGHADTAFAERMEAFALKSAREGKQETSWTNPNADYEVALKRFIRALLDPTASAGFLASFAAFAERTALLGALNSLSQLALKTLLPILDSLDRALKTNAASLDDFHSGIELIDKQFHDALAKLGVEPIAAERESFDPNLHQAMYEMETTEGPPGYVAQVIQAGYMIGDRVLRPAMVAVSKMPKAQPPANDNT